MTLWQSKRIKPLVCSLRRKIRAVCDRQAVVFKVEVKLKCQLDNKEKGVLLLFLTNGSTYLSYNKLE